MPKLKEWLSKFEMKNLRINTKFLEVEFEWNNKEKNAAWELYVELLTRITTQNLPDKDGDEESALNSIYSLFEITRKILKEKGRKCTNFTKISIVILNQIIRPFTTKWHKLKLKDAFIDSKKCKEFREELKNLRHDLIIWTKMLADIAEVEDLIDFDLSYEDIN